MLDQFIAIVLCHYDVLYLLRVQVPLFLELARLLLEHAHELFVDALNARLPLLDFFHLLL